MLSGFVTLLLMLLFIAIWAWAWQPVNRKGFDDAARLALDDVPGDVPGDDREARP